jgi:hypothetical protein
MEGRRPTIPVTVLPGGGTVTASTTQCLNHLSMGEEENRKERCSVSNSVALASLHNWKCSSWLFLSM